MSIQYKAVKIVPPSKKEEECNTYYPRIVNRKKKNLLDIGERISQMSTFSTTDVVGVLEAFVSQIPYLLKDNCSVELGDLGTFSLHIHAEGAATPEEVNSRKIKNVRMAFRPSPRVKKNLADADFTKISQE